VEITKSRAVRTRLFYAAPVFVWAAAMLTLSSLPGTSLPSVSLWQWDKLAHAFEYMVFAALIVRWRVAGGGAPLASGLRLGAIAAAVFALLDELHQIPIPYRQCAWQDVVADFAGAFLGLAIAGMLARRGALR
jgi:VanZ family protein